MSSLPTAPNRSWLLHSYPRGLPRPEDFRLTEAPLAQLRPGQVCVRVRYLSMDPAPRLRMDPASRMGPPLALGSLVVGRGAGIVESSACPQFKPGDNVVGELGWQEYAVVDGSAVRLVDCRRSGLSAHLGLLASSGLTAYLTLLECARAAAGEIVVVSAAAGSVGLAACQIAAVLGCRVVAVAHGSSQAHFLRTWLRPAAVVDDLAPDGIEVELARELPGPVDVFLDSVGGRLHNAVMEHINVAGRAVLYGFISAYNASGGAAEEYGRMYQLIRKRARLMGFLLADHSERAAEATQVLTDWLSAGKVQSLEAVTEGFEHVPEAFSALFGECAPGKHLVHLAHTNS